MTSLIARLRVALQLDSAAFERSSKRAAAEVDALGSKAERAGAAVGRGAKLIAVAGAAIAGSAIVGSLVSMAKQGLETASAIGETAKQLGVSAKSFQELSYIATQTGLSQEEMEGGLAKLTRTMSDAAQGAKGPSAAFKELGIDIKAFVASGGDAGQLVPLIADGMGKLATDSDRARVAYDLMGRSGQKWLPTFAEGAKGIHLMAKEAHDFGIVLTDKQIQDADKTADKISKLQRSFDIRIAGVVSDNSTALGDFAEQLAQLADKGLRLLGFLGKLDKDPVWKWITGGVRTFSNPFAMMNTAVSALTAAGNARNSNPAPYAAPTTTRGAGAAAPGWSITGGKRLTSKTPSIFLQGARLAGNSPFKGDLSKTLDSIDTGDAGSTATVMSRLYEIGMTSEEVIKVMDRARTAQVQFADDSEKTSERVTDTFKDMADATLSAFDRLAGAIKGGGFLNILSGVIGMGLQLGKIGLFGSKFAGGINSSKVPAYASGTSFHPGGLALLGERGPELVNLPRGSKVWPNGSGPGGGNVYHISGNLLTPEFWSMIRAGDMNAAAAGAVGGAKRVASSRKWSLT